MSLALLYPPSIPSTGYTSSTAVLVFYVIICLRVISRDGREGGYVLAYYSYSSSLGREISGLNGFVLGIFPNILISSCRKYNDRLTSYIVDSRD
jgi:hypothetical protein